MTTQSLEAKSTIRLEVGLSPCEMTLEPTPDFDGECYLAALTGEPAHGWPEVAEQINAAEDDATAFQDDFVPHANVVLPAASLAFTPAAKEKQQAAKELRRMG